MNNKKAKVIQTVTRKDDSKIETHAVNFETWNRRQTDALPQVISQKRIHKDQRLKKES